MSRPNEHRIFKAILRSVVSDDFSPEDYRAAVKRIRDGSLVNLLEQVVGTLAGSEPDATPSRKSVEAGRPAKKKDSVDVKSADDLFNDVKRRKITRDQLERTLRSIDSGFALKFSEADTIRNLLKIYRDHATEREWTMLSSIINGSYEADPYLTSISEDYAH